MGGLTSQDHKRLSTLLADRTAGNASDNKNIKEIVDNYADRFTTQFTIVAGLSRNPTTGVVTIAVDGQPLVAPGDADIVTEAARIDMNRVANTIVAQNQGKSQLELERLVRDGLNRWYEDNVVGDRGKFQLSDIADLNDRKLTVKGIEYKPEQVKRFQQLIKNPSAAVIPGISGMLDGIYMS